jgi:hypothetical protein
MVEKFNLRKSRKEESSKKMRLIDEFINRKGLEEKTYKMRGRKLLVLSNSRFGAINTEKITSYIEQHIIAAERGIINTCFKVANDACLGRVMTGRVVSWDGTSNFAFYRNHCVNFDELDDGTVISVDLTAASNIDHHQGNFDILGLIAESLPMLLEQLNSLYGGSWEVMNID